MVSAILCNVYVSKSSHLSKPHPCLQNHSNLVAVSDITDRHFQVVVLLTIVARSLQLFPWVGKVRYGGNFDSVQWRFYWTNISCHQCLGSGIDGLFLNGHAGWNFFLSGSVTTEPFKALWGEKEANSKQWHLVTDYGISLSKTGLKLHRLTPSGGTQD